MDNKPLDDKTRELHEGWSMLINQVRIIALLPIDKWLEDLSDAEAIAPFVDPTLYRKYIYSKNPEMVKKILRAALELKRTFEEIKKEVLDSMEAVERGG